MPSLSHRQLFLDHVAQTSDAPLMLEIDRAEGVYLYGTNGQRYLDLIAGIGVSNVGHCHPKVVAAIQQQAAKYMHLMVYGEYVYGPQVEFAELLCSVLPDSLNNVYFVNSGTEATEGAMKLAKRYTGRPEITSFKNSYHGSTQGALSLLGDEYFRNAYRPLLPGTRQLQYNDMGDLQYITHQTACVVMETVQAEAGINPPTPEFVKAIRHRCTEVGALLVLDEIQVGFGRTGSLFAFEQYGIVPDILLLAKGMGGGLPIGAFIANETVMRVLRTDPVLGHITTFGGNAVTCAAGMATLQVLLHENHIAAVKAKEQLFHELLVHPAIRQVRSRGLLMTIELESFEFNKKVIDTCIEQGVITDWFLFAPHCLRIAPPLIITEDQIHEACNVILSALNTHSA